jgi:hypothetical protein
MSNANVDVPILLKVLISPICQKLSILNTLFCQVLLFLSSQNLVTFFFQGEKFEYSFVYFVHGKR